MPRLFIGMPARNAEEYIGEALESLRAQTFTDWELLVSNNSSTDRTLDACSAIASKDSRIKITNQSTDIGAVANFGHVLDRAAGEFFMWAAADDRWHPEFLETCVSALDANPQIGMSFSGIENIDFSGACVRRYVDLPALAGPPGLRTVVRFLLSPEIFGKANLIYSVYRLNICRKTWADVGIPACWGGDMAFVLGAIARGGLIISSRVLFQKRLRRSESVPIGRLGRFSESAVFPFEQFDEYRAGLASAVKGTSFGTVTQVVMTYRYRRAKLARSLRDWRHRWVGRI
jgi:glycosyltransferase involved in cell wall biosynthesis